MNNKTEKQAKFGWRYFHLIDPAGSRINVVDHDTDIFGQTNSQYVTMVVKEPGKKPERFKGSKRAVWDMTLKKKLETLISFLIMLDSKEIYLDMVHTQIFLI